MKLIRYVANARVGPRCPFPFGSAVSIASLLVLVWCLGAQTARGASQPNAWEISDHSAEPGSLYYTAALSAGELADANASGWRLTVVSRLVDGSGLPLGNPAHLLSFADQDQRIQVRWDADAANQLVAWCVLNDQTLYTSALTAVGQATNDYHRHELVFDPSTRLVSYLLDGAKLFTWENWSLPTGSGRISWGADSDVGQGSMNYHQVRFATNGVPLARLEYSAGDSGTAPVQTEKGWERVATAVGAALKDLPVEPDTANAPGVDAYRLAVLSEPGLLGYYPVDGDRGGLLIDRRLPVQNATNVGLINVDDSPGTVGSLSLHGRGGWAELGTVPEYQFPNGVGTIEAMLYQTSNPSDGNPCFYSVRGPEGTRFSLHAHSSGNRLLLWNGGVQKDIPLPANLFLRRTHVAIVFSEATVTTYFDGLPIDTSPWRLGQVMEQQCQIGAADPSGAEPWIGQIDEFAVYSDAQSAGAISARAALFPPSTLIVSNLNDGGPGSLRQALDGVAHGGVITFDPSLKGGTIDLGSGELVINKDVTVLGLGADQLAVSGSRKSRILMLNSNSPPYNILIDGLTVKNGFQREGRGGAILNDHASLIVRNCTVMDSWAFEGGGIYNVGALNINNSTLSGNYAFDGGGAIFNRAELTLSQCTIAGNFGRGGAINIEAGVVKINQSTLSGNHDESEAGGIRNAGGDLKLLNSIVADNSPINIKGNFTQIGPNLLDGNPLLGPLGSYGGPTWTMKPLRGSPPVDAGGSSAFATDQRGEPRPLGAGPDLGAVETSYPAAGNGVSLNGTNQYISIPKLHAPFFDQFTVEAWVYVRSHANWSRLFDFGDGPANNNVLCALSAGTSGRPWFEIFGNSTSRGHIASSVPIELNVWTHLAVVFNGVSGLIYINGSQVAIGPMGRPENIGSTNNYIGKSNWTQDGYADAIVDEFRIWQTERTQAELRADWSRMLSSKEDNLRLYYTFDNVTAGVITNDAFGPPEYNGEAVNDPLLISTEARLSAVPSQNQMSGEKRAYTFSTLAGRALGGSSDGVGSEARFGIVIDVAVDKFGNIYAADIGNSTIRKITPAGVVTTLAGFPGIQGAADGLGAEARFGRISGITVDINGNLFAADSGNQTIRKIAANGMVTTIAGKVGEWGTENGSNDTARFDQPSDVAVDQQGNLYVSESRASRIRKITPDGMVSPFAGRARVQGTNDGRGELARFDTPTSIAIDPDGNLYVADAGNNTIRKITAAGDVSTVAGSPGTSGYVDGIGSAARFGAVGGISSDGEGNVFLADTSYHTLRKLLQNGSVMTMAGSRGIRGPADGTGTNAQFNVPRGVAVDSAGTVYVADSQNFSIRQTTPLGVVSTLAGSMSRSRDSDGTGANARFNIPSGIVSDSKGNVFVADSGNHTIRKITSAGVVSTIAGLAGVHGYVDDVGNRARFFGPTGIAIDHVGNIYVTEYGNKTIRLVTLAGEVTTLAGSPLQQNRIDGVGKEARFRLPMGIAIDGNDNLYVADPNDPYINMGGAIRKLTRQVNQQGVNWNVSTCFESALHFRDYPLGSFSAIAADKSGNLYVPTGEKNTILKIFPSGDVRRIAGLNDVSGDNDGFVARFHHPNGIAVDHSGDLYISDESGTTVRRITASGFTSTLVRSLITPIGDDIGDFRVQLSGITVDDNNNIYIADSYNSLILKGVFTKFEEGKPVSFDLSRGSGQLAVTLVPEEARGQWRFPWEFGWRGSGETVSNLQPGNYDLEFRSSPGWLTPAIGSVGVSSDATAEVTHRYFRTPEADDSNGSPGVLTVYLGAAAPAGAGWRLLGETEDDRYLPSGASRNLLPGTHLVEFRPVEGRVRPPHVAVEIKPELPAYLAASYLLPSGRPVDMELPKKVPQDEISDATGFPFAFNGQLQSDTGYGSGVAVETNVVLTAAHVVFNDQTLSYVSRVYWRGRRGKDAIEPLPLTSRAFFLFSGYAARGTNSYAEQRLKDSGLGYSAGQSTADSRNLDVAALYFSLPVAGGGYGGYLPSDAVPNSWLASTALKMMVGYPVDGSRFGDATIEEGKMYQSEPQPYPWRLAPDPVMGQQQVYLSERVLGYPGNSGGPLYVQFHGRYFPAAVYLGTLFSGERPFASIVRAIDQDVVNLIGEASSLGNNGENNTGGGVISINPKVGDSTALLVYEVQPTNAAPVAIYRKLPLFTTSQIVAPELMVGNLREQTREFDQWLFGRLKSATQSELTNSAGSAGNSAGLLGHLVEDLNAVISNLRVPVYQPERFRGIDVRQEAMDLLSKNPRAGELVWLNRLLLEDAFSGAWVGTNLNGFSIGKSRQICWGVKIGLSAYEIAPIRGWRFPDEVSELLTVDTEHTKTNYITYSPIISTFWTNRESSDWGKHVNWSDDLPFHWENVFITNDGSKTVKADNETWVEAADSLVMTNLTISAARGSTNVLVLGGRDTVLQVNDTLTVTTGGVVDLQGGTMSVRRQLAITGDCANGFAGEVYLNGGTLIVTNSLGDAELVVNAGSLRLVSGTLIVDRLVLAGSCARFVRNEGVVATIGGTNLIGNSDADGDRFGNELEMQYGSDPFNPGSIPTLVLSPIGDMSIDEGSTLEVKLTVSNSPPANVTWSLEGNNPADLWVNGDGLISWSTTEQDGPSTNTVTVKISDSSDPSLSATNGFTVIVNEVNTPPDLNVQPQRAIAGEKWEFLLPGYDADWPANLLTYALVNGPDGLSVNAAGELLWTPPKVQSLSVYSVTIKVSDDGNPSLSATKEFEITVIDDDREAPILSISWESDNLVLSWPASSTFRLYQSIEWGRWDSVEENGIDSSGAIWKHTVQPTDKSVFFRLSKD